MAETICAEARGIPFVMAADVMDDYEVLELLYRMTEKDPLAIVPFGWRVFGREQMDAIKKSLEADGISHASDVIPWMLEAVEAASAAKGAEVKN